MSWVDRYKQNMFITTGDGTRYTVATRPEYSKEAEWNMTEFPFVETDGELVKKARLLKREFPLEFYFIGENCIDQAGLFEQSAMNAGPWLVEHPYYNNILCQVSKIKFDDTELNVTKVTCVAIETIREDGLLLRKNPVDTVLLQAASVSDLIASNPDINPTIQETGSIKDLAEKNYNKGKLIIGIPEEAEEYFNAFNTAISEINAITETPILAMAALNNLILMPARFTTNVQDRIRNIIDQFEALRNTISGLLTPSSRRMYEYQASGFMSALAIAAVTPLQGNYTNPQKAIGIAALITGMKIKFFQDLDQMQGPNGGNPSFYIPDYKLIGAVRDLINTTTSKLYQIALGGRKEFVHTLTEDSNVVLLTHRFYGLDPQDANIEEFISNNNLSYREIALGLAKGRVVRYFK